jgi:hypothetical protein
MWEEMKANGLGAIARYYLQVLGWSVIPLAIRDKHPAWSLLPKTRSGKATWEQYQHQGATLSEVEWWFDRTPSNLGIVTGAISGVVALDCDTVRAYSWVRAHLMDYHDRTPIVSTGKGWHVFFKYPGHDVRNSVSSLGVPGLDVRGDGGYVVAPPSIHPTGKKYEWILPPDTPLLDLPRWFFDPVQGCEPRYLMPAAEFTPRVAGGKSYAQACYDDLIGQLRRARPSSGKGKSKVAGNRNNELNRVAYRLGQLVGLSPDYKLRYGDLDKATVENELRQIAIGLGLPPLEVEWTLKSGFYDGIDQAGKLEKYLEDTRTRWAGRRS